MNSSKQTGQSSDHHKRADVIMVGVLAVCLVYALALAFWHSTWGSAVVVGGGTLLGMIVMLQTLRGTRLFRCLMGVAFMVMSALHIHQSHGTIEMHFSIFVLLALLIFYRDWLPIVVATFTIAIHHFLFFYMQINGVGVWVTEHASWNMIFIHAGYVIAEAGVLVYLAILAYKDALEGESIANATSVMSRSGDSINLSYRVELDSPVAEAFNNFITQLESLVVGVNQKLENLRTMGDALTEKSSQVSSSAEKQAGESDYMVQAMREMSSATAEVARNAEQAATAARNADDHADQGNRAMQNIKQEIGSLNQDIELTGEAVSGTATLAGEIYQVVDVIKGVAEQTNLLALNAAIEAARAGDHGRGFAVVADEVRNLSRRTAQSTAEIQSFIERLQKASASAHEAMGRSQSAVQRCLQAADSSAATLSEMATEVTDISRINAMIASATQQQTAVSDDVASHLNEVDGIARSNAAQAVDLAGLSAELQALSGELEGQLRRFKTQRAH